MTRSRARHQQARKMISKFDFEPQRLNDRQTKDHFSLVNLDSTRGTWYFRNRRHQWQLVARDTQTWLDDEFNQWARRLPSTGFCWNTETSSFRDNVVKWVPKCGPSIHSPDMLISFITASSIGLWRGQITGMHIFEPSMGARAKFASAMDPTRKFSTILAFHGTSQTAASSIKRWLQSRTPSQPSLWPGRIFHV